MDQTTTGYKSIIGQILSDIDYQGDIEKHVGELNDVLQTKVNLATFSSIKEFFEEYLEAIVPTLNEGQKNKLRTRLSELQNSQT